MKVTAVIPARYQSTRLSKKVLADLGGKSILQRVYEQVKKVSSIDEVIIATDHQEIIERCQEFGATSVMTRDDHISGTDRVAEAIKDSDADYVINVQADEPFLEPHCLDELIAQFQSNPHVQIVTLCRKIDTESDLFDFNTVKVTKDFYGKVLYFSRQAIPALRDQPYRKWQSFHQYLSHMGVYGFRKHILMKLVNLPPSPLELSEKLEQLRWMENGFEIYCREVNSVSFGIDTAEDLERARRLL